MAGNGCICLPSLPHFLSGHCAFIEEPFICLFINPKFSHNLENFLSIFTSFPSPFVSFYPFFSSSFLPSVLLPSICPFLLAFFSSILPTSGFPVQFLLHHSVCSLFSFLLSVFPIQTIFSFFHQSVSVFHG